MPVSAARLRRLAKANEFNLPGRLAVQVRQLLHAYDMLPEKASVRVRCLGYGVEWLEFRQTKSLGKFSTETTFLLVDPAYFFGVRWPSPKLDRYEVHLPHCVEMRHATKIRLR